MSKRIGNNVLAIFNFIRLSFLKAISSNEVKFNGREYLSLLSEVQIDKGGKLYLGKWIKAEKRCFFAVREKAILEIGEKSYFNRNCNVVAKEKYL